MGVIRRTKAVDAVLRVFEQTSNAISVVELVNGLSSDMNKTTVYRILERLQDDGQLHSFTGGEGLTWYAKCSNCSAGGHSDIHPHFQCNDCGKVECLEFEVSVPNLPDHQIDSTEFLMAGLCADCKD